MSDPTSLSPAEIDTALAGIYADQQKTTAYLHSERAFLARRDPGPNEQARAEARIADYQARLADLAAQAEPFHDEFTRRGGWNRYFLVTNPGGHVHRGMDCTTCFDTTLYAWLPELSDCDEAAMIDEFGEKACTVCFPDAPTNPAFHRPGRRDQAALDAKAADKAAREAAKAAKAITNPDGSPLRSRYGVIKTKVAARNELSSAVQSYVFYGPGHPQDFLAEITTLKAALDHVGFDTDPVIERAIKKATKEGGTHSLPADVIS